MGQSAADPETTSANADDDAGAPSTVRAAPDSERDTAALLEWLADHDAPCPLCGYNLRALTRPVCPECQQELVLTVGSREVRLAWMLIALVPGFFSGIAALFLAIPVTLSTILNPAAAAPWPIFLVNAFGFASGIAAIVLARKRTWFLRKPRTEQMRLAVSIWGLHVLMFFAFLGLMLYFG